MPGGFTTCTGMFGNGAQIGTVSILKVRRSIHKELKKEPTELFEVEDFTFSPTIADLPKG